MLIKVRVFPNSKKEKIICIAPDIFNIYVRAKPQNGMANEQVINLLVNYFEVSRSQVRIIKGAHLSHKIFDINK